MATVGIKALKCRIFCCFVWYNCVTIYQYVDSHWLFGFGIYFFISWLCRPGQPTSDDYL